MKFDLAPTLSTSSSKPATRKRRTPPSLVAKLGIVRFHIHHGRICRRKNFLNPYGATSPNPSPKGLCKPANPQLKYEPKSYFVCSLLLTTGQIKQNKQQELGLTPETKTIFGESVQLQGRQQRNCETQALCWYWKWFIV